MNSEKLGESFFQGRNAIEKVIAPVIKSVPGTPNQITVSRLPLAVGSGIAHATLGPVVGGIGFAVVSLLDWVDGAKARLTGQDSEEGKILDPLCDKVIIVCNYLYAGFALTNDIVSQVGMVINAVQDIYSQQKRGNPLSIDLWKTTLNQDLVTPSRPDSNNGANAWGKLKTISQSLSIFGLYLDPVIIEQLEKMEFSSPEQIHTWIIRVLVVASVGLSVQSILGRSPKK